MRPENLVRYALIAFASSLSLLACAGSQAEAVPPPAPVTQAEVPAEAPPSTDPGPGEPAVHDADAQGTPASSDSPLPAGARVIASRPTVEGGLSEDAVADTVATARGQFETCYAAELYRDPDASGRIRVRFRIDTNGVPASDHITGSMGAPALETCITEALLALRFPAAASDSGVSCPFLFEPPGAAE
jgi:outer membrane biosynthesis protein TonB